MARWSFPALGALRKALAARAPARARVAVPAVADRTVRAWGPAALGGGLLGVALACVVYAPASWLAAGLDQASGGRLRLDNPAGTLWNGSAALVLAPGGRAADGALALPSRIHWALRPSLQGATVQLQADCCAQAPLRLLATPGGLHLPAGQLQLPLAVLQGLGTPWNTLGVQGQLALRWQDAALSWRGGALQWQGQMEAQALGVSTALSTLPDVGSYRLVLATEQGQPQLQLSTLRGDLVLSGTGHWRGKRLRFTGEGQARSESADALSNLLSLLGERHGTKTKIRLG